MLGNNNLHYDPSRVIDILKVRLRAGLKATPLCLAIIEWMSDTPTIPSVTEIRHSGDGSVLLRLSNERTLEPLCSYLEFLGQINIICEAVGLTEDQTQTAVRWAREKLG